MIKEGYVEKVIYKNDDNGYAVFTVEGEDGEDILSEPFTVSVKESTYLQKGNMSIIPSMISNSNLHPMKSRCRTIW